VNLENYLDPPVLTLSVTAHLHYKRAYCSKERLGQLASPSFPEQYATVPEKKKAPR
jgi:hypothetical protein